MAISDQSQTQVTPWILSDISIHSPVTISISSAPIVFQVVSLLFKGSDHPFQYALLKQ